jgi:iron complex transport system substrate-binding protein
MQRATLSAIGMLAIPAVCLGPAVSPADESRIVTIGGTVTEIVFALGMGEHVVAVDSSSVYPAAVAELPVIGYQRRLAAEGVLSMRPTLVLAGKEAGPAAALAQIENAGVRLLLLPGGPDVEGAKQRVRAIASALDRVADGERIVNEIGADLAAAARLVQATTSKPRVLFLYARGPGTLAVAGRGTEADAMIELAGATNAAREWEGFRPLSAEGVVAAAPEVLVVLTRGLDSIGGSDGVWRLPGLEQTPAGSARRLVAMDDLYLLGFGPRLGKALFDLTRRLHPELADAASRPGGEP